MAFHFTAVNRVFLDVPTGWQFNSALTISAWIWREDASTTDMIIGKYPGQGAQRLRFMCNASNQLSFGANWAVYATWTSTATVASGAWVHVLGTGDGTTAKLAINGVVENKSGANGGISDSTAVNAGIGGADDDGQYFNGWLAEVAIWSATTLTDNQITALADGATPPRVLSAGLMGYWPLRGTTLPMADLSGNGRHLTEHLTNASQFTDPSVHPPVQLSMV